LDDWKNSPQTLGSPLKENSAARLAIVESLDPAIANGAVGVEDLERRFVLGYRKVIDVHPCVPVILGAEAGEKLVEFLLEIIRPCILGNLRVTIHGNDGELVHCRFSL
jgi:hypothetical protein